MSDSGKLLDQLRALWGSRQREVDAKWQRTVPFGDYVVDRWERAKALGWGEGTSVYDSCLILGDVTVGANVWIGPFTVIDGSGGLIIGEGTNVSSGAQLYTHDSSARCVSGGVEPIVRQPTKVGANVYIGPNSVVTMGVTVGDGAIVGANSLVRADVPAGATVFGSPARERAPRSG